MGWKFWYWTCFWRYARVNIRTKSQATNQSTTVTVVDKTFAALCFSSNVYFTHSKFSKFVRRGGSGRSKNDIFWKQWIQVLEKKFKNFSSRSYRKFYCESNGTNCRPLSHLEKKLQPKLSRIPWKKLFFVIFLVKNDIFEENQRLWRWRANV